MTFQLASLDVCFSKSNLRLHWREFLSFKLILGGISRIFDESMSSGIVRSVIVKAGSCFLFLLVIRIYLGTSYIQESRRDSFHFVCSGKSASIISNKL